MRQQAIDVLDQLLGQRDAREQRLTTLLRDKFAEEDHGWHMFVPRCFNEALDIKLTDRVIKGRKERVWTQGSGFAFSVGDTIYDTHEAYQVWRDALRRIKLCVTVIEAQSVSLGEDRRERSSGTVTFTVAAINQEQTRLVERDILTMTQDAFVRFLIDGKC